MKNAVAETRDFSVSFIVTCYNHPEILKVSLESMLAQTRPPDEIIVADDGSTEETFEVTRALRRRTSIPLIHVWQKDEGFRAARSRNNALAVATGDYVVLSDGDCFFGPHYIEDHLAAARPRQMVGGTRVHVLPKRRDYVLRTGDRRITVFTPHTSKRLHAIRSRFLSALTSESSASSGPITLRNSGGINSSNMSLWREDVAKVNGFDERYVGYGHEDFDLAIRLSRSGVDWRRIRHLAVAYHFAHKSRSNELPAAQARLEESYRRPEFRIPDEFGLARAIAEGPERIER